MRISTGTLARSVLLIVTFGCTARCVAADAKGQEQIQPAATSEWITDPVALLTHLKIRDAEFDGRSLRIEQRWIERVTPKSQITAGIRAARRFGNPAAPAPPAESVPPDFDQPHRVQYLLTVRGSEITLEREGDLEVMNHPKYVALANKGLRWSTVGGVERSYSPQTKSLHLMGTPKLTTVLPQNQWMFERCCGYGFAKQMESIDSVRVEGERMFIEGKARLMGYDDSHAKLELDRDYIVRRASVFVPVRRQHVRRRNEGHRAAQGLSTGGQDGTL